MFEVPMFNGTTSPQRIVVQTKAGTDVEAVVGPLPSVQHHHFFGLLCEKHGQNWITRKPPTGGYNCAGLVWATRRAVLPNPQDWETILRQDEYRRLSNHEERHPGDVVVYRSLRTDEIIHVARICLIDSMLLAGVSGDSPRLPCALSKWDLTSGESIHRPEDVFLEGGEAFKIEYYTDRP